MSWIQFAHLLRGSDKNPKKWLAAIEGNPTTPVAALNVAIKDTVIFGEESSVSALSELIISLVKENAEVLDALNDLFDDCVVADVEGDLSSSIKAETLDKVRSALFNVKNRR